MVVIVVFVDSVVIIVVDRVVVDGIVVVER